MKNETRLTISYSIAVIRSAIVPDMLGQAGRFQLREELKERWLDVFRLLDWIGGKGDSEMFPEALVVLYSCERSRFNSTLVLSTFVVSLILHLTAHELECLL